MDLAWLNDGFTQRHRGVDFDALVADAKLDARVQLGFLETGGPLVVGSNAFGSVIDVERSYLCEAFGYTSIKVFSYDTLRDEQPVMSSHIGSSPSSVLVHALGGPSIRDAPLTAECLRRCRENRESMFGARTWATERYAGMEVPLHCVHRRALRLAGDECESAGEFMRVFELFHEDQPELRAAMLFLMGFACYRGVVYYLEHVVCAAPMEWLATRFFDEVTAGLRRIRRPEALFAMTDVYRQAVDLHKARLAEQRRAIPAWDVNFVRTVDVWTPRTGSPILPDPPHVPEIVVEASSDVDSSSAAPATCVQDAVKMQHKTAVHDVVLHESTGKVERGAGHDEKVRQLGEKTWRCFCDWLVEATRPPTHAMPIGGIEALRDLTLAMVKCARLTVYSRDVLRPEIARRVWVDSWTYERDLHSSAHKSARGAGHIVVLGTNAVRNLYAWVTKESQAPRRFQSINVLLEPIHETPEDLHTLVFRRIGRLRAYAETVVVFRNDFTPILNYNMQNRARRSNYWLRDAREVLGSVGPIMMMKEPFRIEFDVSGAFKMQLANSCMFHVDPGGRKIFLSNALGKVIKMRTKRLLQRSWIGGISEDGGDTGDPFYRGWKFTEEVPEMSVSDYGPYWGDIMRQQRKDLLSVLSGMSANMI